MMEKKKVYLASSMEPQFRESIKRAAEILRHIFEDVYVPMEHTITNAWDYPNNEWGLMVFEDDVQAINRSDYVVVLNYGRKNTTAGCAWEAGYAFALGKKVFIVDVYDPKRPDIKTKSDETREYFKDKFITSLMIENGRYATINGLYGLECYDWKNLPRERTLYEQK